MRYFFILGCHRSGTTMLQQALNRHSQIVIPPETKFFSSFVGHSRRCQAQRLEGINEDLGIGLAPPERAICRDEQARQFYEQMARAVLERSGKRDVAFFGEKTPAHSGYVSRIAPVFPGCKFLWIYRDGRDVAASMRRMPWMSKQLAVNFTIWLFYYRKQLRAAQDKALDILFVKYEQLVAEPAANFRRVTDFLELPYERAVAEGNGNQQGVLNWELPWKGSALQPITTARVEAWRDELNAKEVQLLEWLGGWALRDLGYSLTTSKANWSNVMYYPSIALGMLRFVCRLPLDEVANQFLGRPLCLPFGRRRRDVPAHRLVPKPKLGNESEEGDESTPGRQPTVRNIAV